MSKLITALKQAVRYARGDKTAGKATVVTVPVESDLEKAQRGAGRWVPDMLMPPIANISGRVYRTRDGKMGVYYPNAVPFAITSTIEAWFYPETKAAE